MRGRLSEGNSSGCHCPAQPRLRRRRDERSIRGLIGEGGLLTKSTKNDGPDGVVAVVPAFMWNPVDLRLQMHFSDPHDPTTSNIWLLGEAVAAAAAGASAVSGHGGDGSDRFDVG
jgi:hypothetical protein